MSNAPSEALMQAQKAEVDLIQSTVYQVENLTQEQAFDMVGGLVDEGDFNAFKLGGVLTVIHNHPSWYDAEFTSFKEMLLAQFPQVKYRKAMYLMDIYTKLVAAEISWAKVGHLGWTKIKELAAILTKENVDYWIKQAEGMTVLQLIEAIKAATTATPHIGGAEVTEGEVKTLTTITFKVYEDQKETIRDAVKKAKVEAGTEYDNVAIESICMSYLTNTPVVISKEAPDVSTQLKSMGYEEALMLIGTLWPEIEISVRLP